MPRSLTPTAGALRRLAGAPSLSTSSAVPSSSAWSPTLPALLATARGIIVPRQLKAYGGTFSQSIGERADHLASHLVLQSLSPSRVERTNSPLLAKPIKTKTIESFNDMLLLPELRKALTDMGITTPSPIQQAAIEVVLQRKDTLIAAPHGEGKTLAFLLPLYQNMVKDRDVYRIPLRERRPRLILLAPTKELIEQLHGVCRTLDEVTGLKSVSFTSRKRAKYHVSRLLKDSMADVLIMDPKVVLRLIRSRRLFIEDLRYVAVDEADAMLSSLHDHDAVHLLMKVQKRVMYKYLWPVQTQFVFSSPYITRKLEYLVGKRFPKTVPVLFRQRMHRPPQGGTLRHRFLPVHRESEKLPVLLHLLRKHGHVPRELVTDEEELAVHRPHQHYKLSGSLAEYRARRDGVNDDDGGRAGVDAAGKDCIEEDEEGNVVSLGPHHRVASLPASAGPAADAGTTATTDSRDCSADLIRGRGARNKDPSREALSNAEEGETQEHREEKAEGKEEEEEPLPYRQDARSRFELEGVRPLHWGHLTTVAAPFTCPIPRTTFAPGARAIIFFHSIDAATALYHRLHAAGFAVSLLHASLPWAVRKDHFTDFASGRTNLLCATDLAARGLDVHVDLVVHFNMPTNALTYLSRAGRAARMGRLGRVYSLYTKQQGVIVSAVRAFLARDLPLEGLSNHRQHMTQPRYAEWRTHKINALARRHVSLITTKTIPAHLERTYIHHNATWRPVFRPRTAGVHGGVPPRQQQKLMDRVMAQAVQYRREQLARRKGGRAKFGSRSMKSGVWNDVGGVSLRMPAGATQDPHPGGSDFGPPSGPPP